MPVTIMGDIAFIPKEPLLLILNIYTVVTTNARFGILLHCPADKELLHREFTALGVKKIIWEKQTKEDRASPSKSVMQYTFILFCWNFLTSIVQDHSKTSVRYFRKY